MNHSLTEIKFKVKFKNGAPTTDIWTALTDLQAHLIDGEYLYQITLIPSNLIAAKAKYFALVTELGNYCGMQSRKDKELFKSQIKKELGNESIADMITMEQVSIKIEELYQLAATFYDYQFKEYVPIGKV